MVKKIFAEFIGTFFIIFFGFASIINFFNNNLNALYISLAFGVTTLIMFFLFSKISGGYFNPAVSFAFFITGEITLIEMLFYILAELFAGFIAMVILALIFSRNISYALLNVNSQVINNSDLGESLIIIIVEFISSFILMFVYKFKEKRNFIIIGFIVFILNLVFFNIEGMGLNPVRIIVPSIFALKFNNTIFYLAAIFVGCLAGGLSYHTLFGKGFSLESKKYSSRKNTKIK